MSKSVLVIGSVNYDFIYQVSQLPKPHETIPAHHFATAPGGKGANQAAAAALVSNHAVSLISCVGADMQAEACLNYLKETGVDVSGFIVTAEYPTGTACILVDERGDNFIVVSAGANAKLSGVHLTQTQQKIETASVLLFQLEVPLPTVRAGLELGRSYGKKTILNPAPYVAGVEALLPHVGVLTPNLPEAEMLTGVSIQNERDTATAAKIILETGVSEVIVTLGGEGCFVATQTFVKYLPAYKVPKVLDTSGAGDVFNGALAAALVDGADLVEAADFASASAALSVTKPTASHCAPSRAEALAFQKQSA